jgi:hypothetical protein
MARRIEGVNRPTVIPAQAESTAVFEQRGAGDKAVLDPRIRG